MLGLPAFLERSLKCLRLGRQETRGEFNYYFLSGRSCLQEMACRRGFELENQPCPGSWGSDFSNFRDKGSC